MVGFPGGPAVKDPPANAGDMGSIPGLEDPLEKEMATHSSILAWEIRWTEEPVGLQSVHCFSCVQLFVTPWTIACQAPLSIGFPRQEYWSGLPFPSPGDLPNPEIECTSPA